MDGRHFLEGLKYALLACPKLKDNEPLAKVVFTGRRIVTGDSRRWHVVYLPRGVDLAPLAATRASVEKVKRALNGLVPPKSSEDRVEVKVDGREVVLYDGDEEPVTRALEAAGPGAWPRDWEPPMPAPGSELAGPPPELDTKHVREAASWKDAHLVWYRSPAGTVRADTYVGKELIATAVVLPIDATGIPATDPRQPEMFPPATVPLDQAVPRPPAGEDTVAAAAQRVLDAIPPGTRVTFRVGGESVGSITKPPAEAGDAAEAGTGEDDDAPPPDPAPTDGREQLVLMDRKGWAGLSVAVQDRLKRVTPKGKKRYSLVEVAGGVRVAIGPVAPRDLAAKLAQVRAAEAKARGKPPLRAAAVPVDEVGRG